MRNIIRRYFDKHVTKYIGKWRSMTPKQKWQNVYNVLGILSESVGVTVFTSMNNYWYSYLSEVISFIYFASAFYTIWYYFGQREYFRGLQGTSIAGLVFACLVMQIQTLGPGRYKINSLVNFGGKYIYTDANQTPKLRLVCKKMANKLIRHIVIFLLLTILVFGAVGLSTAYLIVFEGARVTFFSTEIPFFDKNSDTAFWINISFQLSLVALGFVACSIVEIAVALIINAISSVPSLLNVDLEELNTELILNGFTLMAKARLRNVFMKIQDYENVAQGFFEIYYWRIYIGSYLSTLTISFAIFSQLILGNQSGYGIAFGNYVLLLINCYLGENLKRSKEEISSELFNMQWYLLPAKSQRQVCSVIHLVQNGASLKIGPFSTLSMETVTDLTKSIYRFTVLIYRTFN